VRKGSNGSRPMHLVTLGMGSNVGPRESFIKGAIEEVERASEGVLARCSSLYETEPIGKKDQEWFLNCVVQIETPQDVDAFFSRVRGIEARFGRKRLERWGPRNIDIDILFFDNVLIWRPDLQIPHPGIAHRRFVLEPLCEIAPHLVHPVFGVEVRTLLEGLSDTSTVIRLSPIFSTRP